MKRSAALLAAVLAASGCGECGEAPASSSSEGSGQTVSGTSSSGGGGGDVIPLTPRDKKKDDTFAPPKPEAPSATVGDATRRAATAPAGGADTSTLPHIAPADFDKSVKQSKVPVLVIYRTSSCRPCGQVAYEMSQLAPEYAGKVNMLSIDLNATGATALLPTGLRRLPVPAFAFYQDGSPLNIRQGLPITVAWESRSQVKAWLKRVIDGRDVRL